MSGILTRIGVGNLGRVCGGAGKRWATAGVLAFVLVVFLLAGRAGAIPYVGVDTWYAYGLNVDEQTVIHLANAVVRRGLKAVGYQYVWIDAGWWKPTAGPGTPGARDAAGDIELDAAQWPHGLRWLTDYIHSLGLKAGIYTDAGPVGCGNGGSWGHYQQDTDQFATWGFDAVKVDYCSGGRTGNTPQQNYTTFRAALDATGRPMLLDITNVQSVNGVGYWLSAWQFGPLVATAWRTGPDIGWPGHVSWADVLRNLDDDALHPSAQSSGHYNDPDYLVPGATKTRSESAAQVSMWAMLAAPFMVSVDLPHTPKTLLSLITNPEVIAIDQDPTDTQAREVGTSGIWIKPMTVGVAVAFLNRSNRSRVMTASDASIGLGRSLTVRDVWKHAWRPATGNIREIVAPRSAALLRIYARTNFDGTSGRRWSKSGPLHGQAQSGALPDIRRLTKLDQ